MARNRKRNNAGDPQKLSNGPAPAPQDQHTVETTLYEPKQIADRISVERIFRAITSAQDGDTLDLFTLYRDFVLGCSHVQGEFHKRKLAVLGDRLVVSTDDANNAEQTAAAAFVRSVFPGAISGWISACSAIMDSCLWPVSLVEKVYSVRGGKFVLAKLIPVPHHLENYTTGRLRIQRTDEHGMPIQEYEDVDPARYIVHRGHLLNMPDNYGGPMRSILFWTLFATCDRDWWIRFLERFGSPFLVGKYDSGDVKTRDLLRQAFAAATKLFGIAVTRDVEIDLKEAQPSRGDAFELFHSTATREISNLIVGQTLSAKADPTGMGSGVANLQADVREDLRQFDALMLVDTLRSQVLTQLCQANNVPYVPQLIWGSATAKELRSKVGVIKDLSGAGIFPTDDALVKISSDLGFNVAYRDRVAAGQVPSVSLSADAILYRRRREKGA